MQSAYRYVLTGVTVNSNNVLCQSLCLDIYCRNRIYYNCLTHMGLQSYFISPIETAQSDDKSAKVQ